MHVCRENSLESITCFGHALRVFGLRRGTCGAAEPWLSSAGTEDMGGEFESACRPGVSARAAA
jgi:hypothetical protein